ncbi:hypothetical protein [Tenacibaculum finnmarkense]|uniref:hypothetical protein n=1 Tax=Tenacibaculum finnmarkense TaxID=2781243 RepID=UPI001E523540|nr:hypothetical protein [Tenacibaculum finnmarkense]MCD8410779.1 hypothetical protein [Tenacibaculum finnmarkense genomovar ulcerans]MCG8734385.1 hypothetical protein [Tenacibaculum finnmarkense]MCG8858953.1 hypothetical protein [Tenacibaculum finnmarkense]
METIDGFELKELIEKKGRVENRIIKLDSIRQIGYSEFLMLDIGFLRMEQIGLELY